jgi:sirohydrochlorin cobaltochelatase
VNPGSESSSSPGRGVGVHSAGPRRPSGFATRLVLFAHGSRDPRWRKPFEELHEDIAGACGRETVRLAYLEFASPSLHDVACEAHRDGIRTLRVLPLFMAGGAHLHHDLPEFVAKARAAYRDLGIEVLPAIGEHPLFQDLLRGVARGALGSLPR